MTNTIVSIAFSLLALLATPLPVTSFSIQTSQSPSAAGTASIQRIASSATTLKATRKNFLHNSLAAASAVLLVNGPLSALPAHADITSKLASSQALRNVKIAQKKLTSGGVAEYVSTADYADLKAVLRVAPISDIRKACTVLVRAGEDGPEADNLQTAYKLFIGKLEKMDSVASVALRGRTIAQADFEESYNGAVSALNEFVAVAERSIDIPVQYSD